MVDANYKSKPNVSNGQGKSAGSCMDHILVQNPPRHRHQLLNETNYVESAASPHI